MSEPTVEEVREAIDLIDAGMGGVVGIYDAKETVLAAARLWVDAAEPDKDALRKFINGYGIYPYDMGKFVDGIVAAARFCHNCHQYTAVRWVMACDWCPSWNVTEVKSEAPHG